MKMCPKCGKIVSYNSYFGAFICGNCNWEDCPRARLSVTARNISKSTSSSRKHPVSAKMALIKVCTNK